MVRSTLFTLTSSLYSDIYIPVNPRTTTIFFNRCFYRQHLVLFINHQTNLQTQPHTPHLLHSFNCSTYTTDASDSHTTSSQASDPSTEFEEMRFFPQWIGCQRTSTATISSTSSFRCHSPITYPATEWGVQAFEQEVSVCFLPPPGVAYELDVSYPDASEEKKTPSAPLAQPISLMNSSLYLFFSRHLSEPKPQVRPFNLLEPSHQRLTASPAKCPTGLVDLLFSILI